MNISISCCLTSLIIVTAAVVLGLVGMFYKQATCLLVDCVLLLISVFFFLLSLSLHWAHRHPRAASLLGSSLDLLSSQPGWSQYLGQDNYNYNYNNNNQQLSLILSNYNFC